MVKSKSDHNRSYLTRCTGDSLPLRQLLRAPRQRDCRQRATWARRCCSGPNLTRVQAGNTKTAVRQLPFDIHLPNELRRLSLGRFLDVRETGGVDVSSNVILNVAIGKKHCVSTTCGKGRQQFVLPQQRCTFREFVDLEGGNAAETGTHSRSATDIAVAVQDSEVSIVEKHEGENARAIRAQNRRIVLTIVPIDGRLLTGQREITAGTKAPQDVARARAILVVDFDDPILVSHRKDQVSIRRRINDRIGMGPICEPEGSMRKVEMIEG